ncbi:hypothetical protein [Leptothrix ochracea]|uniref:hypothetical protein n=1 Tax=Leptothrix ochracea TaxID=735331 RepID=UPI0034E2F9B1
MNPRLNAWGTMALAAMIGMLGCTPTWADVLPFEVYQAQQRLEAHPDRYDRADQFCRGKRLHARCTIPDSVFSGGGPGTCRIQIDPSLYSIDLSCVLHDEAVVERDLPKGGYQAPDDLCHDGPSPVDGIDCDSAKSAHMPVDRFCRSHFVGERCEVSFVHLGQTLRDSGTCQVVTEERPFYFRGRRKALRNVLRCEPIQPVQRQFTPTSWWERVRPKTRTESAP